MFHGSVSVFRVLVASGGELYDVGARKCWTISQVPEVGCQSGSVFQGSSWISREREAVGSESSCLAGAFRWASCGGKNRGQIYETSDLCGPAGRQELLGSPDKQTAQCHQGIALKHCAVVLTRCLTLVPTRNSQVYDSESSWTMKPTSTKRSQIKHKGVTGRTPATPSARKYFGQKLARRVHSVNESFLA